MKTLMMVALLGLLLAGGCVVVYAPQPSNLGLQNHSQVATNMTVNQDIAVDPRMANEIAPVVGASIKGNSVLSPNVQGNSVASPTTKVGK